MCDNPRQTYLRRCNITLLHTDDGVIAIGSGGAYAQAAARALIDVDGMDAEAIAFKAMNIAAEVCVYTNNNFVMHKLTKGQDSASEDIGKTGSAKK